MTGARQRTTTKPRRLAGKILGLALALAPAASAAPPVVDYQDHLGPRFVKKQRRETRFIVVHSTECGLASALRTLSRGKVRRGRYVTRGDTLTTWWPAAGRSTACSTRDTGLTTPA